MRNYYSNEDVLAAIEERAFCEGYNARMQERMYADEAGAALEKGTEGEKKLLDRLKEYGKKAKDTVWGTEGGWKKNWGKRAGVIAVPVAAAGGTALYLHNKKKKAEAAAEALEAAAEAQRAYSAYLDERIYAEAEEEDVEEVKPSKKHLGKGAAIGAGAGLATAAGLGILSSKKAAKLREDLKTANHIERGEIYENKLFKLDNASKLKKAGLATGAVALGAGAGLATAAAIKKYKDVKAAKALAALEEASED